MAMNIKAMAKEAGISENELKGKSLGEQIKLITKRMNEEKSNMEMEQEKTYISNFEKKLPKFKEELGQPFEVYVRKVGQKKTPTPVPVIGYNSVKDEVVFFSMKNCFQFQMKTWLNQWTNL